jgi:hypothetical protein
VLLYGVAIALDLVLANSTTSSERNEIGPRSQEAQVQTISAFCFSVMLWSMLLACFQFRDSTSRKLNDYKRGKR